jgi:hypothetical protein
MEIALEYNKLRPQHIHFDLVQRNKVIDNGYFIKLNYHNHENDIILYKINLVSNELTMTNYTRSLYNNKHKCYIDYLYIEQNEDNSKFIEFVRKTDNYFNRRAKEYCSKNGVDLRNHTYAGMLKNNTNEKNVGILFRMPINSKDIYNKKDNNSNKYQIILRWNGIWISNDQYGLNYKIVMIVQK